MASSVLKAMTQQATHAVGALNSLKVKTLAHGAKITGAAVDNFTLVELAGYNEDGEQLCKQLSDVTKKSYLIAAPEQRYMNEELAAFYNDVDDYARLVVIEEDYTRFETSAFELDATVTEITEGNVAHFDVASKKFLIHDGAHADYANAKNKFEVVADTTGNFNQDSVRLMAI